MFDPKTKKYPYTQFTDQHYLVVKKNRGIVFDSDYPYLDNSRWFKFKQAMSHILLSIIVFPVATIRLGLKIKGRKIIKENKTLLKNGVISCANHVHLWDYICIMKAIRPFHSNLLSWAKNINGENGTMIRLVGGIPIPENDIRASVIFTQTIDSLLQKGGWLHIYPEGSMWEFYAPIRPFKSGMGYYSVRDNKPILPLAFSYREPGWIRKNIFKQIACFTLTVGDPIMPDMSLDKRARAMDLTIRCHEAVCRLAGIDPKENKYPPVFDNTERVDYY